MEHQQATVVVEEDLNASPPQHQEWTESSEGDVGSLIDCLDDEEDEDVVEPGSIEDVILANRTDEAVAYNTTVESTPIVDCSYADKYRQQRLKEAADQQMAKLSRQPSPAVKNGVTRPDGVSFNLNEPWQRSMMKQLEHPDFARPTKRGCERIFVGHTDSRDYAVSWDDECSAFSLDTTASSTVPIRAQSIHRMSAPTPRVLGYQDNPERGTYAAATPENEASKPEGRDDTMSKPFAASPRTVTDPPVPRKKHPMGTFVGEIESPHMDDSYNMSESTDPACYCLGYNMLDYLLIGTPGPRHRRAHRRSLRPMTRVAEEEPLEQLPARHQVVNTGV